MKLLKIIYEKKHGKPAPYYYNYSIITIVKKPVRKFFAQVVAPNCPFNNIRIMIYRMCGFKIGKNVFIGMKCYLDDMCFDLLTIGNNCIISYGVYFACHGYNQEHYSIEINNGAYIGMRSIIISKNRDKMAGHKGVIIGEKAIVGAGTLVNRDVPKNKVAIGVPCKIVDKDDGASIITPKH